MTGLGVQLYSVRDELTPSLLPATLDRLAALGVTHAEPFDILTDTAGLGAAAAGAGLALASAHAKITELDPERVLDAAGELGIVTVVVPMVPPASIADAAGVDALAERINAVAAISAPWGIRIGYHNHDFEFRRLPDGTTAHERLTARLEPGVVIELDAYWASVGGADVVDLVRHLGDRVRLLHVKDDALVVDGEAAPEPRAVAGPDLRGRMAEVIGLPDHLELAVVEVVVHEGDVWPLLGRTVAAARSALGAGTVA